MVSRKGIMAILVISFMLTSGIGIGIPIFIYRGDFAPKNVIISSGDVILEKGSTIILGKDSEKFNCSFPGGQGYLYGGTIYFNASYFSILRGSWRSTEKTKVGLVKYCNNRDGFFGIPYGPLEYSGTLNYSLSPGSYYILYEGENNDHITVSSSFKLENFSLVSISSLILCKGSSINTVKDPNEKSTYHFKIGENGTLIGSLEMNGSFVISLTGPEQNDILILSNPYPDHHNCSLDYVLSPGNYTLSFSSGIFAIVKTIEVVNFVATCFPVTIER